MYYLTEIRLSDFGLGDTLALARFKLVSRCSDREQRASAEIFQTVKGLESNDRKQALKGLRHLVKLAQLGKPFN